MTHNYIDDRSYVPIVEAKSVFMGVQPQWYRVAILQEGATATAPSPDDYMENRMSAEHSYNAASSDAQVFDSRETGHALEWRSQDVSRGRPNRWRSRVMHVCVLLLLVALQLCVSVVAQEQGQIISEMTDDRINEAIALGQSGKFDDDAYVIRNRGSFGIKGLPIGSLDTPFSRIAQAAADAKREYRSFTRADVTEDMLRPVVRFFALSQRSAHGPHIANVRTVVLVTKGTSDAVQPTQAVESTVRYQNRMGATASGRALMAEFPLAALQKNRELRIVYDREAEYGRCTDCLGVVKWQDIR